MKEEVKQKINKIDRAMAQEGMPLSEEEKKALSDVIVGKKTVEQKVKEVIDLSIKENERSRRKK